MESEGRMDPGVYRGAGILRDIRRENLRFSRGSSYFVKEWKTPAQMNFTELQRFVTDLKRRGYDVQELAVDLYARRRCPSFSLTMVIWASLLLQDG